MERFGAIVERFWTTLDSGEICDNIGQWRVLGQHSTVERFETTVEIYGTTSDSGDIWKNIGQ